MADLDDLAEEIEAVARRVEQQNAATWSKVGQAVKAGAERRVPVKSGRLLRSIKVVDPRQGEVSVVANADGSASYADWVERLHPFMAATSEDMDRVEEILADYVTEPLDG